METKIFHGNLTPNDIGHKLLARFNQGNYRAQKIGSNNRVVVQIATKRFRGAGGHTATTVTVERVEDGIAVQVGKQDWLGVAASLGTTTLAAFRNPFSLIGRLDDLAQDISAIQLRDQIWETIQEMVRAAGASYELSERLRRMVCSYCNTANEVGAPHCLACGAPLGDEQPLTCRHCGFVVHRTETTCPNCKRRL